MVTIYPHISTFSNYILLHSLSFYHFAVKTTSVGSKQQMYTFNGILGRSSLSPQVYLTCSFFFWNFTTPVSYTDMLHMKFGHLHINP